LAKEVLSKKIQEFNTEPAESGFELKTQRMDESAILVKKKKKSSFCDKPYETPEGLYQG